MDAEPAARAAKPPVWVEVQRKRSIEKAASKFPFGKLALVLALLMAAVWAAARFRHGLLE